MLARADDPPTPCQRVQSIDRDPGFEAEALQGFAIAHSDPADWRSMSTPTTRHSATHDDPANPGCMRTA